MRLLGAVAIGLAMMAATPARAKCEVGPVLELKVTMQGARPIVDVGINGRTMPFIADSGAFFSTISPGSAAELGLRLEATPIRMSGIGGEAARTSVTTVKSVELAGMALHAIPFIVGGSEIGGEAGLLGQNVLGIADVEYDLEHGAIRLMRSKGCAGLTNFAYWAGDRPVSMLSIDPRDARHPHTIGAVYLNGARIRAVFDTGAATSLLSLQAAKRAGVTPQSPGVVAAGLSRGLGRKMVPSWIAPFDSFKVGDEEIRHTRLRIGELDMGDADMLVGADFFLSHRIYVANAERKLFFTYDGGPVFNILPNRVLDGQGAVQTIAADTTPAPTDAAGYARRGAAETSRRDFTAALADLDKAIALEPGNARFYFERSRAQLGAGNRAAGFADIDRAATLAPGDAEIRLDHAQSLLTRQRRDDALAELAAADAAMPVQADQRLALAGIYQRLDQFDKAIAQYDRWIAAHPDDSRQPQALNGRCWTRALAGRDLPLALKDCDASLRRSKTANAHDSRGLVELRTGQYDRAIGDYDASLAERPNSAWSLYGRGLARQHKGDAAAAADLAAAAAIDPALQARARALGIN